MHDGELNQLNNKATPSTQYNSIARHRRASSKQVGGLGHELVPNSHECEQDFVDSGEMRPGQLYSPNNNYQLLASGVH